MTQRGIYNQGALKPLASAVGRAKGVDAQPAELEQTHQETGHEEAAHGAERRTSRPRITAALFSFPAGQAPGKRSSSRSVPPARFRPAIPAARHSSAHTGKSNPRRQTTERSRRKSARCSCTGAPGSREGWASRWRDNRATGWTAARRLCAHGCMTINVWRGKCVPATPGASDIGTRQCQEASQSGCCCLLTCLFPTAARWFTLMKTRAIRNAAAAATPPIRVVCKALRKGRVPVKRPLM